MSTQVRPSSPTALLHGAKNGQRANPLLGRVTESVALDDAPAPWQLRQCLETGLVYLDNPPPSEVLISDHAWEVSYRAEATRRAQAEPLRYRFSQAMKAARRRLRRNKVRDLVLQVIRDGAIDSPRVLDVGCGDGKLIIEVMERLDDAGVRHAEPMGIDISLALSRTAHERFVPRGGRCIHASAIEGLNSVAPHTIDVVILSSFLEHETEPVALLRACARILRPGGRVVVKVPNHDCLNRKLRGPRWCGYRWPDHVNYFTPRTLRLVAEAAGLSVTRMSLLDRQVLSDSLYAVLGPPVAPAGAAGGLNAPP
jgi:2-polyprenyl-3-methyl-5-hydroxy-6-metoxy-1,4-benzoquinol methylase